LLVPTASWLPATFQNGPFVGKANADDDATAPTMNIAMTPSNISLVFDPITTDLLPSRQKPGH
jgi:hypothetical protein